MFTCSEKVQQRKSKALLDTGLCACTWYTRRAAGSFTKTWTFVHLTSFGDSPGITEESLKEIFEADYRICVN